MASGLDLIRKAEGSNKDVAVLTFNLITDDQGMKIGKTQGKPI
jgi:tyrosyl-tRNA synthetase